MIVRDALIHGVWLTWMLSGAMALAQPEAGQEAATESATARSADEATSGDASESPSSEPEGSEPEGSVSEGSGEQQPETVGAAEYPGLRERWDKLDELLPKLQQSYAQAEAGDRDAIRKEYLERLAEANALLPKLRVAALAAYAAAPGEDRRLTNLLLGFMFNHNRHDQYEQAREVGELLVANNCRAKGLADQLGIAAYCLDDFDAAGKYLRQAADEQAITPRAGQYLEDIEDAQAAWKREQELRVAEAEAGDLPRVKLETSQGPIVVELYENEAPDTVGNFVSLVESGFYNGLTFHRVLPNFMAQGGCPEGTGSGGPGYEIYCECEREDHRKHFRGTLSMAHAGKDTGGSQFFLTFRRTHHLDGAHTVFGRVIEGWDVLAQLQRRDPSELRKLPEPDKIIKAEVVRKRDHAYAPKKVEK